MSAVPQNHLPSELVHAILIQMRDDDENHLPIKRGLASCSQICRYWAAAIRPELFRDLTLRSGDDVSLLIAFLDADSLQPALSGCIHSLDVVEDQASTGPPWSHQMVRLHRHLPRARIPGWVVKDAPAASDGQDPQAPKSMSPLPFSTLPRALPRSTLFQITSLKLSGLSLRSLRGLASLVRNQILCEQLELDNVTFREETPDEIQLRRVASRSVLYMIEILHVRLDRDAILYWMKASRILFACRDHERLDTAILELVANYLHLLVSHSGRQNQNHSMLLWKKTDNSGMYDHPLSG